MRAPWLWIFLPALWSGVLVLWPASTRTKARVGALVALLLGLSAWFVPIDRLITLVPGRLVVDIDPEAVFLGRILTLDDALRPWVTGIYLNLALWLWTAPWARMRPAFVGWASVFTVLLVAALAIRPFLYTLLLIQLAILTTIPLLAPAEEPIGKGIVRYLAWTTLGLPFLLLAASFMTGLETGTPTSPQVMRAAVLLVVGVLPWLGVVPFHSVAPLMGESTHPYRTAFILSTTTSLIALALVRFGSQYTWLREAPLTYTGLRVAGMTMFLLGSFWAPFQPHAGRALGYAWLAENGLGLLALSLGPETGVPAFVALMPGRMVLLWALALALSLLGEGPATWHREALWGMASRRPLAAGLWVVAWLGMAAWPLSPGAWPRWQIAVGLAGEAAGNLGLYLVGLIALTATALRWARVLTASPPSEAAQHAPGETWWARWGALWGYALLGLATLFLPAWMTWAEKALQTFPQLLGR